MMRVWSFYDEAGNFTGRTYRGTEAHLPSNTPAGCVAREGAEPLPDSSGSERPPEVLARQRRRHLLNACDWVVTRAAETGQPIAPEWAAYRQALRDVPLQPGFPDAIEWPALPG